MKESNQYIKYIKSNTWKKKSRWVRGLTKPWWLSKKAKGRCCLFPFLPAEETHHLTYFFLLNFGWDWFGFEQPIWHLVPLSKFAHRIVSKSFFWQQPVRFLVNTYLRFSFLLLWTICKPWWSIPFWFILIKLIVLGHEYFHF